MAELAQAVTLQESGRVTRIPGIGKKAAKRLLLELKDKLGVDLTTAAGVHREPPASSDVLHALLTPGYSEKEALAAIKTLPEGLSVDRRHPPVTEAFGQSLKRNRSWPSKARISNAS